VGTGAGARRASFPSWSHGLVVTLVTLRPPVLLALKGSLSAVVTGALLLLATVGLLRSPGLHEGLSTLAPGLSYAIVAAGILLAWRFDRIRVLLALAVIGLATWGVTLFPVGSPTQDVPSKIVFGALRLLLPLNLALFAWFTERGALSAAVRLNALLIVTEVVAVVLLCFDASVGQPRLLPRLEDYARFPGPILAVSVAALVATAARFALWRGAVDAGFLWALVAALLALRGGSSPLGTIYYLAAAGLILVVSLIEESYALAYVDELTGLPGRRALNAALLKLGPRFAIAMIDIDHFKRFNDTHGHEVGDQVLRKVAVALAGATGGGNAFRYGGEEFTVVFPGRSLDETMPHLEQLRQVIEDSPFIVRSPRRPRRKPRKPVPVRRAPKKLHITVSIGAAGPNGRVSAPNQVLDAADSALYRAKQAGRNRVAG
jgi:diguanylate cyclase (GGDEF)-like protein